MLVRYGICNRSIACSNSHLTLDIFQTFSEMHRFLLCRVSSTVCHAEFALFYTMLTIEGNALLQLHLNRVGSDEPSYRPFKHKCFIDDTPTVVDTFVHSNEIEVEPYPIIIIMVSSVMRQVGKGYLVVESCLTLQHDWSSTLVMMEAGSECMRQSYLGALFDCYSWVLLRCSSEHIIQETKTLFKCQISMHAIAVDRQAVQMWITLVAGHLASIVCCVKSIGFLKVFPQYGKFISRTTCQTVCVCHQQK